MFKKIASIVLYLCFVTTLGFACTGVNCVETATASSVAAPYFGAFSNDPIGNASGGFGVQAEGVMTVDSYAKGTKSAEATAIAKGQAFGIGGAAGIQTPNFGIGVSGAVAGVALEGGGYAIGKDKYSWFKNPDFASVGIEYKGYASQGNSISVDNGQGTFAYGSSDTSVNFGGSSYVQSYGTFWIFDAGFHAIALNANCGFGLTAGASFGSYIDVPNFASANSFTVGASMYNADYGTVQGTGIAGHQAVAKGSENASYGVSSGQATFCYESSSNFGAGYAKTGGYSVVTNGAHSTSVTSVSHSSAGSTGSYFVQTVK